jgi:membrane protein DedA with SNARE-associated domain
MEALQTYISQYGYWAVFGAILLEDFGIPVPGETVLITAAILASQGRMSLIPLLIVAWFGAVTGDNIGFAIGRFGGRHVALRFGHYVFLTRPRLERTEGFFKKYGGAVVLLARFFEILRQLNGIVAGIVRMNWWRFLTFNGIGAALWVCFWGVIFYVVGGQAIQLLKGFDRLVLVGFAVATVALGFFMLRLLRKE